MREKIDFAFTQAFNLDAAVDRSALAYNVSPGWDSVGHMALVAARGAIRLHARDE